MYAGKLVFAQVMEHLPLHTFRRCVSRYARRAQGQVVLVPRSVPVHGLRATDLSREPARHRGLSARAAAPSSITWAFASTVARNTLADANAVRDWRIYADFAQSLIGIARPLYADEPFGVDLKDTVYALDSTTIDLCLSVFPWAPFRTTKAAVKLHTLLDLRGNIPTFIHISDGKMHDVNILDQLLPGARRLLRHGSRLPRLRASVPLPPGRQLLRHPRQVEPQGPPSLLASRRPHAPG